MPIPNFEPGDRVEVRSAPANPWLPGEVTALGLGAAGDCYAVLLDTPVTSDAWSGVTRRYGGSDTLETVYVHYQTEEFNPVTYIKAEGT